MPHRVHGEGDGRPAVVLDLRGGAELVDRLDRRAEPAAEFDVREGLAPHAHVADVAAGVGGDPRPAAGQAAEVADDVDQVDDAVVADVVEVGGEDAGDGGAHAGGADDADGAVCDQLDVGEAATVNKLVVLADGRAALDRAAGVEVQDAAVARPDQPDAAGRDVDLDRGARDRIAEPDAAAIQ